MANMNLLDKIRQAYAEGKPMPLKGHTKITLTDVNTGEKKIVEEDNLVTNAVASILAHNYSGRANFSSLLPLKSLYGGVLCFDQALTESADNFNPPADNVSQMVACAGQTPHATANPYRGNPNGGQSHTDETSIKFVWDWATNQGNGDIATVCLCSSVLGDVGLKPVDDTASFLTVFGNGQAVYNASVSSTEGIRFPFSISSDGGSSKSLWVSGASAEKDCTTFTESTAKHDYFSFGFLRGSEDWVLSSERTTNIRAGARNNCRFVVDDADYYYVISASNATTLQIDKIAKSNLMVTTADISYSGVSLYTGTITHGFFIRPFAFDGTYLYYPNSTCTQIYRLNLTQSSDFDLLDGTVTVEVGNLSVNSNGNQFMSPIVINSGLVLGSTYLINGDTVYPTSHVRTIGCNDTYHAFSSYLDVVRVGASCFGNAKQGYGNDRATWQTNILCHLFVSTINVLQEPVKKVPSQTMTIEYTITEV